jgi:hypothetical protein
MTNKDIIKEARRLAANISRLAAITGDLTIMQRADLRYSRARARFLASLLEGDPGAAREVAVLRFLGDGEPAARMH